MNTDTNATDLKAIMDALKASKHAENAPIDTKGRAKDVTFPEDAIIGSLGEYARFMAAGTEVPAEFYFAAALTFLGATCGTNLRLNTALRTEPRLYTVLLAESAGGKKSTAASNTANFFRAIWEDVCMRAEGNPEEKMANPVAPVTCDGVGSAEGLAGLFAEEGKFGVVLCYDELQSFMAKAKIESSVLLQMASTLFEQDRYENVTARKKISVENAHLSLVGCCTNETYSGMWDRHSIAIGFPNRLFVVLAGSKEREPWPAPRDKDKLVTIREKILSQLAKLPMTLDIEPDARAEWGRWYKALPFNSVHTRRLDGLGFRLMMLLSLTTDKTIIDLQTIQAVIAILDYQLKVRMVTDPIDADNKIAELEQKIIRNLKTRGPMSKGLLFKFVNGARAGTWLFDQALQNLIKYGKVSRTVHGKKETLYLRPEEEEESLAESRPISPVN